MNAGVFREVLALAGVTMALTVAAQTNVPDYSRWFVLPKAQLRTGPADPPAPASSPGEAEYSLQDFQAYHRGQQDFQFIRRVEVPRDPVVRAIDSIFQPEVFHVGRTTTVSCSIFTAIKRRNPLCLLNPCFFEMTF
jgi:hypothetical protein